MPIRVGCEMTDELGQATPMLAILARHSSSVASLEFPDGRITNSTHDRDCLSHELTNN
jgi:hypothetical protein